MLSIINQLVIQGNFGIQNAKNLINEKAFRIDKERFKNIKILLLSNKYYNLSSMIEDLQNDWNEEQIKKILVIPFIFKKIFINQKNRLKNGYKKLFQHRFTKHQFQIWAKKQNLKKMNIKYSNIEIDWMVENFFSDNQRFNNITCLFKKSEGYDIMEQKIVNLMIQVASNNSKFFNDKLVGSVFEYAQSFLQDYNSISNLSEEEMEKLIRELSKMKNSEKPISYFLKKDKIFYLTGKKLIHFLNQSISEKIQEKDVQQIETDRSKLLKLGDEEFQLIQKMYQFNQKKLEIYLNQTIAMYKKAFIAKVKKDYHNKSFDDSSTEELEDFLLKRIFYPYPTVYGLQGTVLISYLKKFNGWENWETTFDEKIVKIIKKKGGYGILLSKTNMTHKQIVHKSSKYRCYDENRLHNWFYQCMILLNLKGEELIKNSPLSEIIKPRTFEQQIKDDFLFERSIITEKFVKDIKEKIEEILGKNKLSQEKVRTIMEKIPILPSLIFNISFYEKKSQKKKYALKFSNYFKI